jgi:hypothetical protein
MVLAEMGIKYRKLKMIPFSFALFKDKLKMDQRPSWTTWNTETAKGRHRETT